VLSTAEREGRPTWLRMKLFPWRARPQTETTPTGPLTSCSAATASGSIRNRPRSSQYTSRSGRPPPPSPPASAANGERGDDADAGVHGERGVPVAPATAEDGDASPPRPRSLDAEPRRPSICIIAASLGGGGGGGGAGSGVWGFWRRGGGGGAVALREAEDSRSFVSAVARPLYYGCLLRAVDGRLSLCALPPVWANFCGLGSRALAGGWLSVSGLGYLALPVYRQCAMKHLYYKLY
jgi:hypothetical protein